MNAESILTVCEADRCQLAQGNLAQPIRSSQSSVSWGTLEVCMSLLQKAFGSMGRDYKPVTVMNRNSASRRGMCHSHPTRT